MMKRAKGATLDENMAETGGQEHTVQGFVSIMGSKGGEKKSALEERRRGARLSIARGMGVRFGVPRAARLGIRLRNTITNNSDRGSRIAPLWRGVWR
jgi:hypothetical protein